MLLDGQGGRADRARAKALFTPRCTRGDASACAGQGLALGDHPDAAALLRRGCAGGELRACEAGCDLADADGCAATARALQRRDDRVRAARLHGVACAGGVLASCPERPDPRQGGAAVKVWTEASLHSGALRRDCRKGKRRACIELADLFLGGVGVRRDADEALRLYDRACKRRRLPGCARVRWATR